MAFRGNFLVKVLVEVLWLGILLVFYDTLFNHTNDVGRLGRRTSICSFWDAITPWKGLIETLFLENAIDFAELVRTGNLDFYLLKPIDEQFLVSLRKIDWSTAPKILLGARHHAFALVRMGWTFNPLDALLGVRWSLFGCGVGPGLQLSVTALVHFGLAGPQREPDGIVVAVHDAHALPARHL